MSGRGRPRGTGSRQRRMRATGLETPWLDFLTMRFAALDPEHSKEWLDAVWRREASGQVLAAVARLPVEEQAVTYEMVRGMGVRRAIRLIDNVLRPPKAENIALSMLRFLDREYPGVDGEALRAALQLAGLLTEDTDTLSLDSNDK